MLSQKAIEIRKTIVKDQHDKSIPLPVKRQEWEDYARQTPLPSSVTAKETVIANVACLWLKPEDQFSNCVIVYLHGGGLVEGSAVTTRELGARLTLITKIPVLIIDYRLAPEHPYPAALNDVKVVYQKLLEQGYVPNQVIFGGDSNGGGLALAALLALRDGGIPLPLCAFLISPVVDLTFSGDSVRTRAEADPFTSEEALRYCAKLYAQSADLRSPYISPLFADLSNLPALLIQVGNDEILLSDSVRLAQNLQAHDSEVQLNVWEDMWHVWHYVAELPEAEKAIWEIRYFIDQQLDRLIAQ